MSKSFPIRVATHLIAAVAGAGLVLAIHRDNEKPEAVRNVEAKTDTMTTPTGFDLSAIEGGTDGRKFRSAGSLPATVKYRVAWRELARDRIPRPERLEVSREILREWIAEDWQSALSTVMAETPDDYKGMLKEFHEVMRSDPVGVWSIIEDRKFGVTTAHLETEWATTLANLGKNEIAEVSARLPEKGRVKLEEMVKQFQAEKKLMEEYQKRASES